MSTTTVQGSGSEVDLVLEMYKNFRSWAVVSLIMGGASLVARETFDPVWGIVLIVIAVLSWKTRIPGMFAVYAVVMAWAAFSNLVSGLSGGERWWLGLALMQVFWTVAIVKQYRKYRYIRLTELYQAGTWPANLDPPRNENVVSGHFAAASVILAACPWLFLPVFCLAIFLFALAAQSSQSPEIAMQSLDQPGFVSLSQFLCSGTLAMTVLALALGTGALVSKTTKRNLAIGGVIASAVFLIILLAFLLIGILIPSVN